LRRRAISLSAAIAVGCPAIAALVWGRPGSAFGVQAPLPGSFPGAPFRATLCWLDAARRVKRAAPELEADQPAAAGLLARSAS
jgi:hypothetical protein